MSKRPAKRPKSAAEGERGRTCFVQGCSTPLVSAYERRYRLCASHRTISVFVIDGVKSRFCQKCGKFHDVEDFDEDRKSCRSSLMRHSLQQRATRQRRSDRKAEEEATKAAGPDESLPTPIIEEAGDRGTPSYGAGAAPPSPWSPPRALRALDGVSVVERFPEAGSGTFTAEGSLLMKQAASSMDATAPGSLRCETSTDADQLVAMVEKVAAAKAPSMVPVGGGAALPLAPAAAGGAFADVVSMEVLSVVAEGFDIDAALAAVEASLAAAGGGDGAAASVPVATVASPAASPVFAAASYSPMHPQHMASDYFAAARPAFEDAVMAPAAAWNAWGFADVADPLAPVLELPHIN